MSAQQIRITGTVQGVGFRPTVWRLAREDGIRGNVWNDSDGVLIHAWGSAAALHHFVQRLRVESPPLARIDSVVCTPLDEENTPPESFHITESQTGKAGTAIAADAATCPECLAEIVDPNNRRYRYPFTNCTHCGPRLSIVRQIPYDRAHTSMAAFTQCPACQAEYADPADRRFHAQANGCAVCGPQLWLEDGEGKRHFAEAQTDAIETVAQLIRQGRIIAIKGIGGFHLACDAGCDDAVASLRQRKQRYHKAFALMARDVEMVEVYAGVDATEAALLHDCAAPIVVLNRSAERLAAAVAPGQQTLGFMLPYTPLHHLLMRELQRPIVLTSGNRSHEPQVTENEEARQRLDGIADYFLMHDRDIVTRLDDSVLRLADGQPRLLRRARGYAPQPMLLPEGFSDPGNILAMGAELKNTFCLLKPRQAILSQHIGDLEAAETYRDYRYNLQRYRQLFDFKPSLIAVDAHPDYLSTRLGHQIAADEAIPLIEVHHHHAHIAACMAEHGLPLECNKVLGVALDGLGYGNNAELWGGEFLLADYAGYQRLAHFRPVAMPGGTQAIHEPWRNTYAHLATALGWEQVSGRYSELELTAFLNRKPLASLQTMMEKGLNSPPASSAGRLFDAVAAALGICRDRSGFEGQAAIELEALAAPHFAGQREHAYGYEIDGECLSWAPLWSSLLDDLQTGVAPGMIAARFHLGVVSAVAQTAVRLCAEYGVQTVVLSGGVFQNRLLLEGVSQQLHEQGLEVLSPVAIPANDGSLSLGQAVVAAAMTL